MEFRRTVLRQHLFQFSLPKKSSGRVTVKDSLKRYLLATATVWRLQTSELACMLKLAHWPLQPCHCRRDTVSKKCASATSEGDAPCSVETVW